MNYYIQKPDELYHYGVKGMRWGHRKAHESNSNGHKRMSTAKKVAIGVGVAAAVGGITYASIKGRGALGRKFVNSNRARTVRFTTTRHKPLSITGPVGLSKAQMRTANRNRQRMVRSYSRFGRRFNNRDWLTRTGDNIYYDRLTRDAFNQDPSYFLKR